MQLTWVSAVRGYQGRVGPIFGRFARNGPVFGIGDFSPGFEPTPGSAIDGMRAAIHMSTVDLGTNTKWSCKTWSRFRQEDGTLDPLAPFKVLTVMCHPNNRIQREKMLETS